MHEQRVAASFDDADTRRDAMHSTVDEWLDDLIEAIDEARESEAFQTWLDAQSQFHDYSYRNSLLIKRQCPEATTVAGYRTWQDEFDRHVQEGESAIWIWAPIITTRCPECHNAPSYHDDIDCAYDETSPEEWDDGLVGFRPASVFDVSQTEGEPLPELDTAARGRADGLFDRLIDAGDALDVRVSIVPEADWSHGAAKGVMHSPLDRGPVVKVRERDRTAMAGTLLHEYAHALLHDAMSEESNRAARELEAEAVAYVTGRQFGLDMSGSAFYLASWSDDEETVIRERLARISRTASAIVEATGASRWR